MSESIPSNEPPPITETPSVLAMAGFWRRVGAFVIDLLVLAAMGMLIGVLLYAPLAALGPAAQFIGVSIAVAYFGIQNSRMCGGQTLGKRALGIRVVGPAGAPVSFGRSVVRALLICVVFIDFDSFKSFTGLPVQIIGGAIALWVLALGYFFVFNRANRRSAHDFLTDTYVARTGDGEIRLQPVSRAMIAGFAVLAVLLVAGSIGLSVVFRNGAVMGLDLGQIERAQKTLLQNPRVHYATVTYLYTWHSGQEDRSSTYSATVWWNDTSLDFPEEAEGVADILIQNLEEGELERPDFIQVNITTGYDLGIASSFSSQSATKTFDEWAAGDQAQSPD